MHCEYIVLSQCKHSCSSYPLPVSLPNNLHLHVPESKSMVSALHTCTRVCLCACKGGHVCLRKCVHTWTCTCTYLSLFCILVPVSACMFKCVHVGMCMCREYTALSQCTLAPSLLPCTSTYMYMCLSLRAWFLLPIPVTCVCLCACMYMWLSV